MRIAELIVDYVEEPAHPDGLFFYGAVFRGSKDANQYFADAEPPTHDAWIGKALHGTAKGVIDGTRTFIRKQVAEDIGMSVQAPSGMDAGLGELSSDLASLIPGTDGLSASAPDDADPQTDEEQKQGGGGGGGDSRSSARKPKAGAARIVDGPRLAINGDNGFLVARVLVPESEAARTVRADALVVVEGGGTEGEPPVGARSPRVLGWRITDGSKETAESALSLPAGPQEEWFVYAEYLPDAVVRMKVSTQAAADA
jgi:hypothetical protein